MKNFNSLYSILLESLLLEMVGKTDIVDLYIILALPKLEHPAHDFVAQEVVKETSGRILSECEHVVLRELRHFTSMSTLGEFSNETESFKRIAKVKDLTEYEEDGWLDYIDEYTEEIGEELGLPKLMPQTAMQWANFATALNKAGKYLRIGAKNKKVEMSIEALNKASGYNFNYAFIGRLFEHGGWDDAYGGYKWTAVAQAVDNLKTSSRGKFIFYLDRLVDLVHNTGSVLNKFRSYKQGWLTYILDLKQHAINLNELIPYASPRVRKLFTTPEWRFFKMNMPGGNETAGVERIVHKAILKFNKQSGNWGSPGYGEIMDLIVNTKNNLIEAIQNLYNHSDQATRTKLKAAFKKMLTTTIKYGSVKLFFEPTKSQLLRWTDDGDLFSHYDDDMDDYDKIMSQKERLIKAKVLLKFMYDGSKAVGINTDPFLAAALKKWQKHGDDWSHEDDEDDSW